MKLSALVPVLFASSLAAAQPAAPADPAAPAPAPAAEPAAPAMAPAPPPTVEPQPAVTAQPRRRKLLGVGYKAGNGVGFLGADVIIDPLPHVGLDLQGSMMPVSTSTGQTGNIYAIAPAVHGYLFDARSTPYVALGMVAASLSIGTASSSVVGTFMNVGYAWRWRFGLGLQLGAGVGYLSKGEAHDGANMVTFGGQWNPNIEIGLRYYLF